MCADTNVVPGVIFFLFEAGWTPCVWCLGNHKRTQKVGVYIRVCLCATGWCCGCSKPKHIAQSTTSRIYESVAGLRDKCARQQAGSEPLPLVIVPSALGGAVKYTDERYIQIWCCESEDTRCLLKCSDERLDRYYSDSVGCNREDNGRVASDGCAISYNLQYTHLVIML